MTVPIDPETKQRNNNLKWHIARSIDRVMKDNDLSLKQVATNAGMGESVVSKARNNSDMSLLNFVKLLLGLPAPARKDCVEAIFFSPIPSLPKAIEKKISHRDRIKQAGYERTRTRRKERIVKEIVGEIDN